MAIATDYRSNENFDLQPFYKAGTTSVHKWLHRTRGVNITASSYVDDFSTEIENSNDYIVQGYSTNGMAGTKLYQLQAQIVKVSDGTAIEKFELPGLVFNSDDSSDDS